MPQQSLYPLTVASVDDTCASPLKVGAGGGRGQPLSAVASSLSGVPRGCSPQVAVRANIWDSSIPVVRVFVRRPDELEIGYTRSTDFGVMRLVRVLPV